MRLLGKRPALFKSGHWYFHQDNPPVHNSILVTDYLTKMGIKTVSHPPYCPDLALCDFCYSLNSEAVVMRQLRRWKRLWRRSLTRLTQEDFHGVFQKLLEQYNLEHCRRRLLWGGTKVFMYVLSIKGPIRKKSGNLFNDPPTTIVFIMF